MIVTAVKLIGKEYLDKACSFTANKEVHPNLYKMYRCEHSPIRTQMFWIEMLNIKTFISVHLVRHKHGVEHFVKSNRNDRTSYTGDLGRNQPLNHAMLINAQALINMARKRLCSNAHPETYVVMSMIKNAIRKVDLELAECMVPDCEYRNGCYELKSCGRFHK